MTLSEKKELKYRIERAICERLVGKVCGNSEIAYKWGCMPNSDGYKEAERIFNEKYRLIKFSQLVKEILITWYNELIYRKRIDVKREYFIDDNDNKKLYNSVKEDVMKENIDGKLSGVYSDFIDNSDENSSIINKVEETFGIIKKCAEDNKEIQGLIDLSKIDKVMDAFDKINVKETGLLDSKTDEVISGIKDFCNMNINTKVNKKNNEYENYIRAEKIKRKINQQLKYITQDEDSFYEVGFKSTHNNVKYNQFKKNEINLEFERLVDIYLDERLRNLDTNKKRNRTAKSILEKILNGDIKKNKSKYSYLRENYIAFEDMYMDSREDDIDDIIDYYNMERRYNLRLYKEIIYDIINYKEMKKFHYEELIRRVARVTILDNCMYRHLYVKEVLENLAFEIEDGKDNYYNEMMNEIENIINIKSNIVKDMLNIETLKGEEKFIESIKESLVEILNIDENYLKDLRNIDLSEGFTIKNNKDKEGLLQNFNIENDEEINKSIYTTLYKFLEYNSEIFKERYEFTNL